MRKSRNASSKHLDKTKEKSSDQSVWKAVGEKKNQKTEQIRKKQTIRCEGQKSITLANQERIFQNHQNTLESGQKTKRLRLNSVTDQSNTSVSNSSDSGVASIRDSTCEAEELDLEPEVGLVKVPLVKQKIRVFDCVEEAYRHLKSSKLRQKIAIVCLNNLQVEGIHHSDLTVNWCQSKMKPGKSKTPKKQVSEGTDGKASKEKQSVPNIVTTYTKSDTGSIVMDKVNKEQLNDKKKGKSGEKGHVTGKQSDDSPKVNRKVSAARTEAVKGDTESCKDPRASSSDKKSLAAKPEITTESSDDEKTTSTKTKKSPIKKMPNKKRSQVKQVTEGLGSRQEPESHTAAEKPSSEAKNSLKSPARRKKSDTSQSVTNTQVGDNGSKLPGKQNSLLVDKLGSDSSSTDLKSRDPSESSTPGKPRSRNSSASPRRPKSKPGSASESTSPAKRQKSPKSSPAKASPVDQKSDLVLDSSSQKEENPVTLNIRTSVDEVIDAVANRVREELKNSPSKSPRKPRKSDSPDKKELSSPRKGEKTTKETKTKKSDSQGCDNCSANKKSPNSKTASPRRGKSKSELKTVTKELNFENDEIMKVILEKSKVSYPSDFQYKYISANNESGPLPLNELIDKIKAKTNADDELTAVLGKVSEPDYGSEKSLSPVPGEIVNTSTDSDKTIVDFDRSVENLNSENENILTSSNDNNSAETTDFAENKNESGKITEENNESKKDVKAKKSEKELPGEKTKECLLKPELESKESSKTYNESSAVETVSVFEMFGLKLKTKKNEDIRKEQDWKKESKKLEDLHEKAEEKPEDHQGLEEAGEKVAGSKEDSDDDVMIIAETKAEENVVILSDDDETEIHASGSRKKKKSDEKRVKPKFSTVNKVVEPKPLDVLNVLENPVSKKESAFVCKELDKFFISDQDHSQESTTDNLKKESPKAYVKDELKKADPDFDEIDGHVFISFASENALKAHIAVQKKADWLTEEQFEKIALFKQMKERQHDSGTRRVTDIKSADEQKLNFRGIPMRLLKYQKMLKQELEDILLGRQQKSSEKLHLKTPQKTADITKIKGWKNKFRSAEELQEATGINISESGKVHWKTEERLVKNLDPEDLKDIGLDLKKKRRKLVNYSSKKKKDQDPENMEYEYDIDDFAITEHDVYNEDEEKPFPDKIPYCVKYLSQHKYGARKLFVKKMRLDAEDERILQKLGTQKCRETRSEDKRGVKPKKEKEICMFSKITSSMAVAAVSALDKRLINKAKSLERSEMRRLKKKEGKTPKKDNTTESFLEEMVEDSTHVNEVNTVESDQDDQKESPGKEVEATEEQQQSEPKELKVKSRRHSSASSSRRRSGHFEEDLKTEVKQDLPEHTCTEPGCRYGCICHLCKVSDSSEEKEAELKPPCDKEYCRLGCICDSIDTTTTDTHHCRKPGCMFECKCPPKQPKPDIPREKCRKKKGKSSKKKRRLSEKCAEDSGKEEVITEADDNDWEPPSKKKKASSNSRYANLPKRETTYRVAKNLDAVSRKAMEVYASSEMFTEQKVRRRKSDQNYEDFLSSTEMKWSQDEKSGKMSQSAERNEEMVLEISDEESVLDEMVEETTQSCARVRPYNGPYRQKRDSMQLNKRKGGPGSKTTVRNVIDLVDSDKEDNSQKLVDNSKKNDLPATSSDNKQPQSVTEKMGLTKKIAPDQKPEVKPQSKKSKWKTQMVCLKAKKKPDDKAEQETPAEIKLLEIMSNCNWEVDRTNMLSKISHIISKENLGESKTSQFVSWGGYLLEFMPKANKPAVIPPELKSKLPSEMFSIRIKVVKDTCNVSRKGAAEESSGLEVKESAEGSSQLSEEEKRRNSLKLQKKLIDKIKFAERLRNLIIAEQEKGITPSKFSVNREGIEKALKKYKTQLWKAYTGSSDFTLQQLKQALQAAKGNKSLPGSSVQATGSSSISAVLSESPCDVMSSGTLTRLQSQGLTVLQSNMPPASVGQSFINLRNLQTAVTVDSANAGSFGNVIVHGSLQGSHPVPVPGTFVPLGTVATGQSYNQEGNGTQIVNFANQSLQNAMGHVSGAVSVAFPANFVPNVPASFCNIAHKTVPPNATNCVRIEPQDILSRYPAPKSKSSVGILSPWTHSPSDVSAQSQVVTSSTSLVPSAPAVPVVSAQIQGLSTSQPMKLSAVVIKGNIQPAKVPLSVSSDKSNEIVNSSGVSLAVSTLAGVPLKSSFVGGAKVAASTALHEPPSVLVNNTGTISSHGFASGSMGGVPPVSFGCVSKMTLGSVPTVVSLSSVPAAIQNAISISKTTPGNQAPGKIIFMNGPPPQTVRPGMVRPQLVGSVTLPSNTDTAVSTVNTPKSAVNPEQPKTISSVSNSNFATILTPSGPKHVIAHPNGTATGIYPVRFDSGTTNTEMHVALPGPEMIGLPKVSSLPFTLIPSGDGSDKSQKMLLVPITSGFTQSLSAAKSVNTLTNKSHLQSVSPELARIDSPPILQPNSLGRITPPAGAVSQAVTGKVHGTSLITGKPVELAVSEENAKVSGYHTSFANFVKQHTPSQVTNIVEKANVKNKNKKNTEKEKIVELDSKKDGDKAQEADKVRATNAEPNDCGTASGCASVNGSEAENISKIGSLDGHDCVQISDSDDNGDLDSLASSTRSVSSLSEIIKSDVHKLEQIAEDCDNKTVSHVEPYRNFEEENEEVKGILGIKDTTDAEMADETLTIETKQGEMKVSNSENDNVEGGGPESAKHDAEMENDADEGCLVIDEDADSNKAAESKTGQDDSKMGAEGMKRRTESLEGMVEHGLKKLRMEIAERRKAYGSESGQAIQIDDSEDSDVDVMTYDLAESLFHNSPGGAAKSRKFEVEQIADKEDLQVKKISLHLGSCKSGKSQIQTSEAKAVRMPKSKQNREKYRRLQLKQLFEYLEKVVFRYNPELQHFNGVIPKHMILDEAQNLLKALKQRHDLLKECLDDGLQYKKSLEYKLKALIASFIRAGLPKLVMRNFLISVEKAARPSPARHRKPGVIPPEPEEENDSVLDFEALTTAEVKARLYPITPDPAPLHQSEGKAELHTECLKLSSAQTDEVPSQSTDDNLDLNAAAVIDLDSVARSPTVINLDSELVSVADIDLDSTVTCQPSSSSYGFDQFSFLKNGRTEKDGSVQPSGASPGQTLNLEQVSEHRWSENHPGMLKFREVSKKGEKTGIQASIGNVNKTENSKDVLLSRTVSDSPDISVSCVRVNAEQISPSIDDEICSTTGDTVLDNEDDFLQFEGIADINQSEDLVHPAGDVMNQSESVS